jgi:DNA-directed RNA polymerase specialized sigma24 family protein
VYVDRTDPRRLAILSDPETHKAIRKILRLRGVPRQDLHDEMSTVLMDAMVAPNLPLDDPERARAYLGGIARNKAIGNANDRKEAAENTVALDDVGPGVAAPSAETQPETRVLAVDAQKKGLSLFPRTFGWFVRVRVKGDSPEDVARDHNVSAGYVRSEVSTIGRTLATVLGAGMVAILLLVFGPWKRQPDWAERPYAQRRAVPVLDAAALRDRAKKLCDAGEWQACMEDLDAASELRPAGETQELRTLRFDAWQHTRMTERPKGWTPDGK